MANDVHRFTITRRRQRCWMRRDPLCTKVQGPHWNCGKPADGHGTRAVEPRSPVRNPATRGAVVTLRCALSLTYSRPQSARDLLVAALMLRRFTTVSVARRLGVARLAVAVLVVLAALAAANHQCSGASQTTSAGTGAGYGLAAGAALVLAGINLLPCLLLTIAHTRSRQRWRPTASQVAAIACAAQSVCAALIIPWPYRVLALVLVGYDVVFLTIVAVVSLRALEQRT